MRLLWGVFLSAALCLAGCSDQQLTRLPGDSEHSQTVAGLTVLLDGQETDVLDFGSGETGTALDDALTLRSTGDEPVTLLGLELHGAAFAGVELPEAGRVLAPDEVEGLVLRFTPLQAGPAQGELVVHSTDELRPRRSIALRGHGQTGALVLEPASWDFGTAPLECFEPRQVEFRLTNGGDAPITVGSVEVSGPGFGLLLPTDLEGREMLPGAIAAFHVTFEPAQVGLHSGSLLVRDAEGAGALGAGLVAQALPDLEMRELFRVPTQEAADILVVIDNSCSMYEEQTGMASNLDVFIDTLVASNTEYQLATSSTEASGILGGSEPIIDWAHPDPAGAFAANVQLGTWGSAYERALDSALAVLEPSRIGPSGVYAGFVREAAQLHLVFVTDEPEQSSALVDHWAYLDAFAALKGDPQQVGISAITGGRDGCFTASPNPDLVDLADATGGVVASICSPDWAETLGDVAGVASGGAPLVRLSQEPDPATIQVWVDGAEQTSGWEFDAGSRRIHFDVPPPEAGLVEVRYVLLEDCAE